MNELITIIVPIYNVEKYLNQCISSILSQTYKNLEIILVDDGSPDDCGKICDNFAKQDNRIKVIHKENGGLSSARNAGLDIATGEYISFIDSDDYISLEFIEKLYNLCKKNNVDISECDFQKFENKLLIESKKINIKLYSSFEMLENLFSKEYLKTVVVWNKLYKRYLYKELRFPNGKINEDEFTTYKVLYNCQSSVAVTNEKLYYYRNNSQSIMGKEFNVKRLDALEALKQQKQFYHELEYNSLLEKVTYRYQKLLKNQFILTKKYIDSPDKYLKYIKKELRNNFKDYKKITNVSAKEKAKMFLFSQIPNFYCTLINIRNEGLIK